MNQYEEWAQAQELKGRTVAPTTAPYFAPKTTPKRNRSRADRDQAATYEAGNRGCINRDPAHLEQFTAAECEAYHGRQ